MRRIALLATASVLVAGVTAAQPGSAAMHEMDTIGNMAPHPDLRHAGRRNVRRARHLLRESRATAHAFDTFGEARRLGYRIKRRFRPGFTHLRKNGTRFWGRLFDAAAPQSLVFWCPSRGRCTLTTYMYRAPGGRPPSTWRSLLQWHRHGHAATASWATHVWLVPHVRDAFATCAPWPALRAALGIKQEDYRAIEIDRPCPASMPG